MLPSRRLKGYGVDAMVTVPARLSRARGAAVVGVRSMLRADDGEPGAPGEGSLADRGAGLSAPGQGARAGIEVDHGDPVGAQARQDVPEQQRRHRLTGPDRAAEHQDPGTAVDGQLGPRPVALKQVGLARAMPAGNDGHPPGPDFATPGRWPGERPFDPW